MSVPTGSKNGFKRLAVIASLLFSIGFVALIYLHEDHNSRQNKIPFEKERSLLSNNPSPIQGLRVSTTTFPTTISIQRPSTITTNTGKENQNNEKTSNVATTATTSSRKAKATNLGKSSILPTASPTIKNFYDYKPPEGFQDFMWQQFYDHCFERDTMKCLFRNNTGIMSTTLACENCCEIYHYCDTHVVGLIDDIDGFCDFDVILDKKMLTTCDCLNDNSLHKAWAFYKQRLVNC